MKAIVVLHRKPSFDNARMHALLPSEVRYAWEGMKHGIVRAVHYVTTGDGGVLELEAASPEEVRAFVDALPLVAAGALNVEILNLAPYAGFELLMTSEAVAAG